MKAKKKDTISQDKYKWTSADSQFIESFVEFGFVVVKSVFPADFIERMYGMFLLGIVNIKKSLLRRVPTAKSHI